MTPVREPELRAAIAAAERHVASLRVTVAIARVDADPARHRRRALGGLVAIGVVGFLGSFAWGRHLTREATSYHDRVVLDARDEQILVDRRALDTCQTTRAHASTLLAACTHEVTVLAPYTRARVATECECQMGDPLCGCR